MYNVLSTCINPYSIVINIDFMSKTNVKYGFQRQYNS
jgi:hypothetical protein